MTEGQRDKLRKVREAIDDVNRDDGEEFIEDLGGEMVEAMACLHSLIVEAIGAE